MDECDIVLGHVLRIIGSMSHADRYRYNQDYIDHAITPAIRLSQFCMSDAGFISYARFPTPLNRAPKIRDWMAQDDNHSLYISDIIK